MPSRLSDRPRARSLPVDQRASLDEIAETTTPPQRSVHSNDRGDHNTIENTDWLTLCALSLAVSAIFIAALVYFNEGDSSGAAAVLGGTATIIAVALFFTKAPAARS